MGKEVEELKKLYADHLENAQMTEFDKNMLQTVKDSE